MVTIWLVTVGLSVIALALCGFVALGQRQQSKRMDSLSSSAGEPQQGKRDVRSAKRGDYDLADLAETRLRHGEDHAW